MKNLIFAANGPEPELVFRDAVNNDIEIVRNGEYCLVYDQPIPVDGLTFSNLIDWWPGPGAPASISTIAYESLWEIARPNFAFPTLMRSAIRTAVSIPLF